ncbi:MAG: rod shape-determining protein MreC [Alphaproteobacteria bacterium]|nr:rod shape-determining protein MreC [Alphaproteobacteria bacterium]
MYKYTITPSKLIAQNSLKYIVNLMNFERLQSQNALLKIENHKLRNIILENSIIATNEKRIIDSLNVSSFINDFGTKARVIFSSINENKNYAIITGGKSANIKVGDIMLSNKALAGRVIATGENYTKVLLVTTSNSRVPVISASKDMRAIIAGDADLGAVLIYPQGSELCKKNDILYTSGEGLMYPRGIAVATMHKDVSRGCIPKLLMDIDNLDVVEIIDSSQFFVE